MTTANYGKRVIAVFLDWLYAVVPPVTFFIIGLIMVLAETATALGILLMIAGSIGWLVLSIQNKIFREGKTGQSFGKARMNISLIDSSSGQPLGALHRTLSPTQDVDCRARHAVGVAGNQKSDVERTHG